MLITERGQGLNVDGGEGGSALCLQLVQGKANRSYPNHSWLVPIMFAMLESLTQHANASPNIIERSNETLWEALGSG